MSHIKVWKDVKAKGSVAPPLLRRKLADGTVMTVERTRLTPEVLSEAYAMHERWCHEALRQRLSKIEYLQATVDELKKVKGNSAKRPVQAFLEGPIGPRLAHTEACLMAQVKAMLAP
jgi:hypothetical protein